MKEVILLSSLWTWCCIINSYAIESSFINITNCTVAAAVIPNAKLRNCDTFVLKNGKTLFAKIVSENKQTFHLKLCSSKRKKRIAKTTVVYHGSIRPPELDTALLVSLTLIGLMLWIPPLGIAGILMAAFAILRIKRKPKARKGLKLAIASLVINSIIFLKMLLTKWKI